MTDEQFKAIMDEFAGLKQGQELILKQINTLIETWFKLLNETGFPKKK